MRLFFPAPDKEKDHQAYMVYVLSIVWALTMAVVVNVTWVLFPGLWQRYVLFFSIAVFIAVLNLSLNQWVSTKLASWTLPISCWLIVTLSCYTAGGIQSPHIITQLIVILTAAYLLGWRGGLAFALVSAGVDLMYAYMETTGTLPTPTVVHTPISRWIGTLIPFGTIIVLQHYATNHLRSSLTAARREMMKREKAEKERAETLYDMNERVKELRTLYAVSKILQDETSSIEKLFTEIAELLPTGWQYPEVAAAKLFLGDSEFTSENYHATEYSQRAELKTRKSTNVGIEVVYLVEKPELDEGPFLKEERRMIDTLVEMLKTYLDERERLAELKDYQFALDEAALVSVSSAEGLFTFVNDNFSKTSKYSREELIGKDHSILWSGYHPPEYFDELTANMQNGLPHKGEFCNKAKDGSLYWVDSTIIPFVNGDGKVYQYLTINYDITPRKLAEQETKASEEKFRGLVEQAGDAIVMFDPKFNISSVNEATCALTHYTREELIGMYIKDVIGEQEHMDFEKRMDILNAEGISVHERKVKRKNGSLVDTEVNIRPLKEVGYIAIIRDITERKIAEEELKASEEKFRTLIEQAGDAIFKTDPNEPFLLSVNRAACTLLGYTREELMSMSFEQCFFEEDIATQPLRFSKLNENRTSMVTERRMRRKDGSGVYTELNTGLLEGNRYISIVRDVTERKEAELKLRQSRELLEKSEEMQRAMINNMSNGLLLLDKDLKAIYQSPSGERITGYTAEERLNGSAGLMAYPDDAERVKGILQEALKNPNVPIRFESRAIHKSGNIIWLDNQAINLLDNPSIGAIMINYSDITERKKATELFQHQFENSPDLIVIVDKEHRIESINRTLPGRPEPETFLGKDAVEVLPEEHWEVARNSIDACYDGKGIIEIENSLRNGRWVRSRFVPIVIDDAVRNVMVIATDITEQREAELRLRQSEEKNRALVENIAEAIVLIDANEDIIYQSPAVTKITGYDPEDSYGVGSFEFIHPLDVVEFRKFLGEVIGTPGVPFQRQFRVLHKDGHTIWVEGTLVNMLDNDSINGIVVNYRDITDRLNAEKEKQEIQERTMAMLEDKVVERTQELYDTNQILATKNVEITDSINYAVNIQRAMLSKAEDCLRIFPDSFLFWRPKDIVSGDFCWCYSNDMYDFVAVVDCTGHGVPGALMSLIANQMFDRVVNIDGVLEPKEILEQLNHAIVTSLNQETGLVKDGMDLALCRIDKQNSELKFAGAQLPMYYFNNGELTVVEGSKAGIGGLIIEDKPKEYIQEAIKYNAGDTFYLTSDGYYDQFGGDRGKKMMKKRFRELLSTVVSKPIHAQSEPIGVYFDEWRGHEEQVDDVMVMGVQL